MSTGAGERAAALGALVGGVLATLLAPVAGAWLAGRPLPELAFPPRPVEPGPASLHVPAAVAVGWIGAAVVWAALAAAFGCRPGDGADLGRGERRAGGEAGCAGVAGKRRPAPSAREGSSVPRRPPPRPHEGRERERQGAPRGRWPAWGWAALAWTALWWLVAWTRIPALDPVQPLTFTPLWLGYIATAAAGVRALGGRLPAPGTLGLLAAASGAYWWLYEHLNLFVRNWHYLGTERYDDAAYALLATAAFATVLPAVLLTAALLARLPRPWRCPARLRPVRASRPRCAAALWALAGLGLLAAAGAFPAQAYPLIWAAPAMVLAGLQRLLGGRTWLAPLARGDWRPVVLPALAALVCGLFWELWNWRSLARWDYTLPGLQAPRLFAMPLTGWAGYLPFGVTCAVFADLVLRAAGRGGLAAALGWNALYESPEEGSR